MIVFCEVLSYLSIIMIAICFILIEQGYTPEELKFNGLDIKIDEANEAMLRISNKLIQLLSQYSVSCDDLKKFVENCLYPKKLMKILKPMAGTRSSQLSQSITVYSDFLIVIIYFEFLLLNY